MTNIPPRRQTPFKPSGQTPVDPDTQCLVDPAAPDSVPDQTPNQAEKDSPAQSGQLPQVPDGWIARNVAQERLSLADIDLDSRRIRHLCARNQLENVKVKNEKNQPQYFINPASLDDFIAKNRPAVQSGTFPDSLPDETPKSVANTDPAPSGMNNPVPDQSAGQAPVAAWVQKTQLDQALQTIEFLQEEIRHSRTYKNDTAQIANRMLETLETLAVGGKLMPSQEPKPNPNPVSVNVHQPGASEQSLHRPDGV